MANVVKLKRSAVTGNVPTTSQLELGEVALNTFDGDLFFKKDNGSESIVSVVTTDGTQTLTNKTFDSFNINDITVTFNNDTDSLSFTNSTEVATLDISQSGEILTTVKAQTLTNKTIGDDLTITGSLILETDAENVDLSSGAGIIDDQGVDGTSGQFLSSTGSGVRWVSNTAGNLSGLGDVSLSGLTTNQILKYNGTVWVNADENAVVTSAVFATNATSDLGLVTDANISLTEDLQGDGLGGDIAAYYNLGALAIDGVVGLRNVDQSLKADYISYAIIFGF